MSYEVETIYYRITTADRIREFKKRLENTDYLNEEFQLNNKYLAFKIARYYDDSWEYEYQRIRNLCDSIWDYIDYKCGKYMLRRHMITKDDLSDPYISVRLFEKTNIDIEGDKPICPKLEPLRLLRLKMIDFLRKRNEDW